MSSLSVFEHTRFDDICKRWIWPCCLRITSYRLFRNGSVSVLCMPRAVLRCVCVHECQLVQQFDFSLLGNTGNARKWTTLKSYGRLNSLFLCLSFGFISCVSEADDESLLELEKKNGSTENRFCHKFFALVPRYSWWVFAVPVVYTVFLSFYTLKATDKRRRNFWEKMGERKRDADDANARRRGAGCTQSRLNDDNLTGIVRIWPIEYNLQGLLSLNKAASIHQVNI